MPSSQFFSSDGTFGLESVRSSGAITGVIEAAVISRR